MLSTKVSSSCGLWNYIWCPRPSWCEDELSDRKYSVTLISLKILGGQITNPDFIKALFSRVWNLNNFIFVLSCDLVDFDNFNRGIRGISTKRIRVWGYKSPEIFLAVISIIMVWFAMYLNFWNTFAYNFLNNGPIFNPLSPLNPLSLLCTARTKEWECECGRVHKSWTDSKGTSRLKIRALLRRLKTNIFQDLCTLPHSHPNSFILALWLSRSDL